MISSHSPSPPLPPSPPRLLTIAGSDSGGGAGVQADLKTFAAHGTFGMSAVTALTAQNTVEVRGVFAVAPEFVAAQIEAVWDDLGVDAIKIGMLGNAELVHAVAATLRARLQALQTTVPIVLDPVMVAKSGASLLADSAISALLLELVPLATLVTPNLPELARLCGLSAERVEDEDGRIAAAASLIARGPAVLVKGGHGTGDELVDLLVTAREGGGHGGVQVERHVNRRIATRSTHGTGCTLSSAIAARLGRGESLSLAVSGAIDYLHGAIASAAAQTSLGRGHGPVDHFYRVARRGELGGGFA